jgi:fructose-1,6-bisphosphatase I
LFGFEFRPRYIGSYGLGYTSHHDPGREFFFILIHGKYPKGKLRLLYECNPMAMIVEQAGGVAITCDLQRILELPVNELHQRATISIGSPKMVMEMKAFVEKYSATVKN